MKLTRKQIRKLLNETISPIGYGISDQGGRSDYFYNTYRKQTKHDEKMAIPDEEANPNYYKRGFEHGMSLITQYADPSRGDINDRELSAYLDENPLINHPDFRNGFNEAYMTIEFQILGQYEP